MQADRGPAAHQAGKSVVVLEGAGPDRWPDLDRKALERRPTVDRGGAWLASKADRIFDLATARSASRPTRRTWQGAHLLVDERPHPSVHRSHPEDSPLAPVASIAWARLTGSTSTAKKLPLDEP